MLMEPNSVGLCKLCQNVCETYKPCDLYSAFFQLWAAMGVAGDRRVALSALFFLHNSRLLLLLLITKRPRDKRQLYELSSTVCVSLCVCVFVCVSVLVHHMLMMTITIMIM